MHWEFVRTSILMNNSPLVSVIIPTFNRAYIIHKAIESVLHQKFKNFELIVIDDGSEDNTDEVISDYKPVIYIKKKHEGQAAARTSPPPSDAAIVVLLGVR